MANSNIHTDLPNSIDEARRLGARYYYTGVACVRGHVTHRYVVSRKCFQCAKDDRKAFPLEKNRQQERARYAKNSKPFIENQKRHYKRNIERLRAEARARYWKDPIKGYQRLKDWRVRNRGYVCYLNNKRRVAKLMATPPWVDEAAILAIYESCPKGMHVDHIEPLQGRNLCGLHVPWNLQYLTPQENSSKSNRVF